MRTTWIGPVLTGILLTAACGTDAAPPAFDRGSKRQPVNALTKASAGNMLNTLRARLNTKIRIPDELKIEQGPCGEANAAYFPDEKTIVMCDELLAEIEDLWFDEDLSDAENEERALGAFRFVFFHEMGHALRDLHDLPLTGREEDAVDDLATLLLLEAGLSDQALSAAGFWYRKADQTDQLDDSDFLDEHSLDLQRFGAILCLVVGSDPAEFAEEATLLPDDRAEECPQEFRDKKRAWDRILAPIKR